MTLIARIARRAFALCFALAPALSLVASHTPAQAQPLPAVPPLLAHAAEDFRLHTRPLPDHFRRVRLGEFTAPDGRTRTVLCGEFKAGDRGPWTPFATVQTDPYEQWLGDGARGFCKAPGFKGGAADLSAVLRQQLAPAASVSSAPAR